MARSAKKTARKSKRAKPVVKEISDMPKTAETVPIANSKIDRQITMDKIRNFNLFAAAANILFAVLSLIFIKSQAVGLSLAYATPDRLTGDLAAGYNNFGEIEVKYLLAVIFGLSAIFSLLLATRLRTRYQLQVGRSVSWMRWIFMGITLGLSLELLTALAGIENIITLKTVVGLIITAAVLAVMVEKQNQALRRQFSAFYLSIFTGALAWLPLAGSLIGTSVYGLTSFGWWIYLLVFYTLAVFAGIASNQYRHAKDGVIPASYLVLEARYLSLDFILKAVLFVVILVAFI